MNKITYNGIDYPTRTFDVYLADETEDDIQQITIATNLLSEAIDGLIDLIDYNEEHFIDEAIYFYVDEEHFDLEADVICRLHLDEEFVFVTECE